jgi:putative addiction module component (TIGR02574 family)
LAIVTTDPTRILGEALALPLRERAHLIAQLLASLDGEPDEDVEEAWAAEIERRARRVLEGDAEFEDWEAVRLELRPRS